jgi:hypothetical protein
MKNMMVSQIKKACEENRFIVLRHASGFLMGVNCRVATLKKLEDKVDLETDYMSFYPASFHEYISLKAPFINK